MSHVPTWGAPPRSSVKAVSSVACIAFVILLALAFWAGVLWIANAIMPLVGG